MRKLVAGLGILAVCVFAPSTTRADNFEPVHSSVVTTPSVTSTPLPDAKGETTLGGVTSNLSGTPGQAGAVTVNVNLNVAINPNAVGQEYTVREAGDCKGMKFTMTDAFIRAHELEHVAQINRAVNDYLNNNPNPNDNVTYQQSTGRFKFNGTVTDNATLQQRINGKVSDLVKDLGKNDQNEYANHDFGPGTLEGGARAASCADFMNRIGNGLCRTCKTPRMR